MGCDPLFAKIGEELANVRLVNTHDHIMGQEQAMRMAKDNRMLYNVMLCQNNRSLLSYMPGEAYRMAQFDFGEAFGTSEGERGADEAGIADLWDGLEKALRLSRNDNQQRTFMQALKKLLGLDFSVIGTRDQWVEASMKYAAANLDSGWYATVLEDNAKFATTLDVSFPTPEVDRRYFRSVLNLGDFLRGYDKSVLGKLTSRHAAGPVTDFDAYLGMLDGAIRDAAARGTVALKDATAYIRDMRYRNVDKRDAAKAFNHVSHLGWANISSDGADIRNFQDFIMHELCRGCANYGIPFQIHSGPPANPAAADPMKLLELIEAHPETTFVILHALGPQADEVSSLLKFYPNVHLDLAWHLNGFPGPRALTRKLAEMFEYVPYHKFTWGADCAAVEESMGIMDQAREVLANALAQKVLDGWEDEDSAIEIGRMILRDNALALYNLSL